MNVLPGLARGDATREFGRVCTTALRFWELCRSVLDRCHVLELARIGVAGDVVIVVGFPDLLLVCQPDDGLEQVSLDDAASGRTTRARGEAAFWQ